MFPWRPSFLEVITIFDWLGDLIGGIGDAIGSVFTFLGEQISNVIWDTMLQWFYTTIYDAVAQFFTMMGNMGAEIFDLDWVKATIELFTLFGWALFIAGVVVAVFDVAIEYQHGRADIKSAALNVLKGFFACSLIGVVPVELYRFCISLQNTFSGDLTRIFAGQQSLGLAGTSTSVLEGTFAVSATLNFNLFNILSLIAFAYCVIKIFFRKHQTWRHPAHPDVRGRIVYVQCSQGLYRWIRPVDATSGSTVPDCLHADHAPLLGAFDLPRKYALGARYYAGSQ